MDYLESCHKQASKGIFSLETTLLVQYPRNAIGVAHHLAIEDSEGLDVGRSVHTQIIVASSKDSNSYPIFVVVVASTCMNYLELHLKGIFSCVRIRWFVRIHTERTGHLY